MKAQLWLAWSRYIVARLSWPGLLGSGLILAAVAVHIGLTVPQLTRNADLRGELDRLRAQAATMPAALPAADASRIAALPSGDQLVPLVAAVHAAARQRQIALDLGEYLWQAESGGGRYRMSFPARGGYPQLRCWIADVLAAGPGLTLEEFDVHRDNIGNGRVEAQVRFSIRVGGEES